MSRNIKLLCVFAAIFVFHILQEVNGIGVNYGTLGNNLPNPGQAIATLKSRGVRKIRIYTPNQAILNALRGSGIEVLVGTLNEDLPRLSQDASFANNWVRANIAPYARTVRISGIVAGNEVEFSPFGAHVYGAMQNIDNALRAANINNVPVTTAVSYGVMGSSYPPSTGSISPRAWQFMAGVTRFLNSKGYPLLANIYPYFAYASNPSNIQLDFALLKRNNPGFVDGGKRYTNLLHAMVDALYSALERIGGNNVKVIVSETGWPSAMGVATTVDNAREYNNNLVQLIDGAGTPKRPSTRLETYIFAMFNENQKPGGIEQHWGLFYPNLQEVYHVDFFRRRFESQNVTVTNNFDADSIDMDSSEEADSSEKTEDFEGL